MATALLAAVLSLCCSGVFFVIAAKDQKATCVAKAGAQITKVSSVGTIVVECPENLELDPPFVDATATANVFMSPKADAVSQSVSKACPGASCVKLSSNPKAYSLTIAQLPPQSTTFYFHCVKKPQQVNGQNNEDCYIGIEVGASPRLGPNTCALAASQINFSVQNADEVVQFACGAENTLHPLDDKHTYDETCTNEIALPEGALINKQEKDPYRLTVQKLPATPRGICYICKGKPSQEGAAEMKCEVRIAIAKSEGFAAAFPRAAAALGYILPVIAFLWVQ